MLAACSDAPPYEYVGADGPLHATPTCVIHDGIADVALDSGYEVSIALPALPDAWGRGGVSLASTEGDCVFDWGTAGAPVEYGDPTPQGYRPLYVDALSFAASAPCSSCDPSDCRTWAGTSVDHWYLWCAP